MKDDIKDLGEGVVGVLELSVFMAEHFKDGAQFADLIAFWEKWKDDDEFNLKMKQAFEGYKNISSEVRDIDAEEVVQIISLSAPYLLKIVNAFKKS